MSLSHHEDPAGGPMPPLDPMKVKPCDAVIGWICVVILAVLCVSVISGAI